MPGQRAHADAETVARLIDDNAAIIDAYTAGETIGSIARRYDAERIDVRHLLHAYGVPRRATRAAPALAQLDEAAIVSAYQAGATARELADRHGVSPGRINAVLGRHLVSRRPRHLSAALANANAAVDGPTATVTQLTPRTSRQTSSDAVIDVTEHRQRVS